MPFSLRQPVQKLEDMKLNNDFAALPISIGIHHHFSIAIEEFKKKFRKMRTSLDPFGVLYTFYMSISFPFTLPKYAIDFLSDKYTFIFSNLQATKVRYVFDGKQ